MFRCPQLKNDTNCIAFMVPHSHWLLHRCWGSFCFGVILFEISLNDLVPILADLGSNLTDLGSSLTDLGSNLTHLGTREDFGSPATRKGLQWFSRSGSSHGIPDALLLR